MGGETEMSYRSENLAADIRRRLNDEEYWLTRRPICDECGEHIQDDHLYVINGKIMCESCVEDCRRYTDDFI
jgi:formylmethanofuran dehydrogenase subunit E